MRKRVVVKNFAVPLLATRGQQKHIITQQLALISAAVKSNFTSQCRNRMLFVFIKNIFSSLLSVHNLFPSQIFHY